MKISNLFLVKGTAWTIGAFGFSIVFRLITNVTLTRLLAPELFGIMVLVNSIRMGIELISDVGIGQNIVHNRNSDKPEFYNTAWTLRIIRSTILWFVCLIAATPIAHFYDAPVLATVLPVAGLFFVISALGSVATSLLQKRMQYIRLNVFDATQEVVSSLSHIALALLTPTIWALIFGGLLASSIRAASSYFVLPSIRHRLHISRDYALQIFSFGKWIFLSSIIYFLSMNFDKLYYGKVAVLGMVGIYGIARTLSDLVGTLTTRLSAYLVFPIVAASQSLPRDQLRASLAPKRLVFLAVIAVGIAFMATIADFIIRILYDDRYHAASWMLPPLLLGAWFSTLSSLNESTLLGFGKPMYNAAANAFKFAWLLLGFPFAFAQFGLAGAILVVATADFWRYVPSLVGQIREKFSFARQDFLATLLMFVLFGLFEWLRWRIGFGTSFDDLAVPGLS